MTPEQSKQLNKISESLARLEGAVTEHAKSVERQFNDLHGRIGSVKADAHERMNRIDEDVSEVRHEIHKPAAITGGTAGTIAGFLASFLPALFGGK